MNINHRLFRKQFGFKLNSSRRMEKNGMNSNIALDLLWLFYYTHMLENENKVTIIPKYIIFIFFYYHLRNYYKLSLM